MTDERDRKAEHLRLALDERMQVRRSDFERWSFGHCALPEIRLEDVDTSCTFLGKPLAAPLLISCMTGGTEQATRINRTLAEAAQRRSIAFGVGSQRRALEDPATAATFEVRSVAPTIPLLANLGAVQLNYGYGPQECRRAVESIGADGLALHLNPLQEAIQPEGQTDFRGLQEKIATVAAELDVPVVVKEIGCGLSGRVVRGLVDAGVRLFDTAGMGGTSWAAIEGSRADDVELGDRFKDWGLPTTESIIELRRIEGISIIGSGGLRNGIDAAKAIALGADMAGMAYPFLRAAEEGLDAVLAKIDRTIQELKISMFCTAAPSLAALQRVELIRRAGVERR